MSCGISLASIPGLSGFISHHQPHSLHLNQFPDCVLIRTLSTCSSLCLERFSAVLLPPTLLHSSVCSLPPKVIFSGYFLKPPPTFLAVFLFLAHTQSVTMSSESCACFQADRTQSAAVTNVPRSRGANAAEVSVILLTLHVVTVCSLPSSRRGAGRWAVAILGISSCCARAKRGLWRLSRWHLSARARSSVAGPPTTAGETAPATASQTG